ncbi:putative non-specific serine/threonine protein kinase [Medicago truncatula]|uniref:Putative non-specific serine/threonine protein kinase n=1 Tax=Medicago truncatula TaxID=3880 RepID=A0A396GH56_MEDTR|nr:putative non-specific serine/threonine protein kinase [Medicago truncatula]
MLLNSEVIWLKGNGLKGGLPTLTSNVNILGISDNYLFGSLAPLLCNKKMNSKSNLQYLNIFNNSLSQVTDCWKNWKSLVHVDIGRNNLTGVIPHSMGSLLNIFSLHLDHNNFHGEIPLSLKNCKKMMILNLGENKFSRSIPNWIGHDVKALRLRSNEFRGEHLGIQFLLTLSLQIKGNELYYKDYAHVIDLSNNHLFGKIPLEVCKLATLQSLNLSHNQLMGTIPKEIGNMKQLESLNFSNNTLSGEIPKSMSALTFLEALNLSFNNLEGQIPLGTQLQSFNDISYMGNPKTLWSSTDQEMQLRQSMCW